ncbi:LysR substrate-binding domain-containing protein [Xylophilus sp.]|uniref:LysR substrate-binding domain-containing protein n=1 Tax=Xylophilus sp. TaxID=2653893 RepID=UPI0013B99B07|nr:LysR substrate-binding domain-containing protein [Xylophilus sp.]KAF1045511.1 MAG: Hydrogen peroxide-inducible genes activator [Xylophilus sp.]
MRLVNFDIDVLRSFATGMALGSYARAADRLGRSPSAVSAQLRKLEDQAGTPLFQRAGRGLALTEAGHTLLAYAQRLLDLNDEAVTALRGADLAGRVRLGLQEDFGERLLPAVLGRFARAHPKVRIDVRVARSADLREAVGQGALDLALVWDAFGDGSGGGEPIARLPLHWIGPAGAPPAWTPGEPLPLVLLEAPCPLREIATGALDGAGIAWRQAFSSASVVALWAATASGLGLTLRTRIGLPADLQLLDPAAAGLPALPAMALGLHRSPAAHDAPAERLGGMLLEAVRELVEL